MSVFHRTVKWITSAMVIPILGFVACAQTPQPPFALFERAALTGSGNTVTATQVPVVISSGVTIYVNLTMKFNVDSNGNLTVAAGFPQQVAAPNVIVSGFKAGNYAGPSTVLNSKALISVSGPGVTDGGATVWTSSASTGADGCTYPLTANWYVGPIASNPIASRLSRAGITSTAYSYGVSNGAGCNGGGNFGGNALIGASQVGNTITFVSFSDGNGDHATPTQQITYTLAP